MTQKVKAIFDHAHSNTYDWINFQLAWICTSTQKISLFHLFIFEIRSILESRDQIGYTPFLSYNVQPKHFWSTFDFCDFVSRCKELHCFIDLLWKNGWFKSPGIWLAETILAYISETRFSQIYDLYRNTANNIIFIIEQIHWKLLTRFFFKFKESSKTLALPCTKW